MLVDIRVRDRLSEPVIGDFVENTGSSELGMLLVDEATYARELGKLLAIVFVDARAAQRLLGSAIGDVVESARAPELARLLNNDIEVEPYKVTVIVLVGLTYTMGLPKIPVDVAVVPVYMASFVDARGFPARVLTLVDDGLKEFGIR